MQTVERLHYESIVVPLYQARDNALALDLLDADVLVVARVVAERPVYMRINHPDAPPIECVQGFTLRLRTGRIRRIYLTHAAEKNGFIWFLLGGPEEMEFVYPQSVIVSGFDVHLAMLSTIRNAVIGELQAAITGNDLSAVLASFSSPLEANAQWVSPWVILDRFGTLCVTIVSDVPGTLYVEQSQGGAQTYPVDAQEIHEYGGGSDPTGLEIPVVAPFGRLRYVNGSTAQTTFRIYARGRVV